MRPSITLLLSGVFIAYIAHSIWVLASLFIAPSCKGDNKMCFPSYFNTKRDLQLLLYISHNTNPLQHEVKLIDNVDKFDYLAPYDKQLDLELPKRTLNNGSLFLHVVLAAANKKWQWGELQRDGPTIIRRIPLTKYAVPQAAIFNLLGEQTANKLPAKTKTQNIKPVTHMKPEVSFAMLTDQMSLPAKEMPPELARYIRVTQDHEFLPILIYDFLKSRVRNLVEVTKNTTKMPLHVYYAPISVGKLRLLVHVELALESLTTLGFSEKDIDEVKGIFSDTNVYLLCGTVFIGSIHLLFDFLAFKNDVSFWRKKSSMAGLSTRTVLWRAFSQIVVFLYLLDENTSLLVLIPTGIGTLIEMWKAKKVLRVRISLSGISVNSNENTVAERNTDEADAQAMCYLSYLLYPLCIGGAIYSLAYQPHKSWYSWSINSLVNGVYAFGFLFMLPQLFVNYKLRSVAALPWRAFMYKAFNTFIDDIFAFIITMPTAHRMACFRDDIVFLIYLYQRWLYPVDKSRIDENSLPAEAEKDTPQLEEEKKTN